MERREISKDLYDKIIKQIPKKIIEMLPDKPENLLKYATRIKEVQFSKNVDEPTKKLMKEKLLSDEEYLRTFFFVMAITFYNKKRVENPQIKIVAAQIGSRVRSFMADYQNIVALMEKRGAPQEEYTQLNEIYGRYEYYKSRIKDADER